MSSAVDEVLEVERALGAVVLAPHVLGRDDRPLHHEHLDARGQQGRRELAGVLRAHARRDGGAAGPDPLERLGEQRGLHRRGVQALQLGDRVGRVGGGARDDLGQHLLGLRVARPQALGVEHAEPAEPADLGGGGR